MKIYTIFDRAIETHSNIMLLPTDAVAIRTFSEGVQDDKTMLHKHAEDYSLWCIGEFDEREGTITNNTRRQVISATQIKG